MSKKTSVQTGKSLLSKGLSLSSLTLCSRILGLVREMTKAKFLGTSALGDAFGIAFQVPNFCRRLFAENSVSVAFIPTFKKYLVAQEAEAGEATGQSESGSARAETQEFINATLTLVTFLTAALVSLGMVFTPLILRIFFPEESGEALGESIVLTRIMFPYLVVISVAALFQGILNGHKLFSPSGFTPVLFNAIVISLTYLLAPRMANPARAMAVGVIAGGSVQAAFQLPFVFRCGWKLSFTSLRKAFSNPGTRTVLRLVGPTMIGMAAYQLNDIVSSALATRAGEGVYSSIQYSLRLQELILGICAVTVSTLILPDLTGFAQKKEWDSFCSMLTFAVRIISLIAIPITFFSLIMKESIITLVFKSGRFDAASIRMTEEVFSFHIAGLLFIAVNRVVAPAFYAQQDTKSPTVAGLINFAVNMILAFSLSLRFGGAGIALALTVASLVNMVFLFVFLRRNPVIDVGVVVRPSLLYMARLAVMSLAASLPVYLLRDRLLALFAGRGRIFSHGIPLCLAALLFGGLGLCMLLVTKDEILSSVMRKVRRRSRG